ncbi:MAG: site-specific DNA-methyltransferase, partial [Candidatus Riesia sp.]|nr:site-specific DNA-methyltransferase [Candidatus Riesia sp.]
MYRDNKLDLSSIDIRREKLRQLKTIFPEVFCEDQIDFDKLKLILGNSVVSEKERFGFNWSGKADCFKIIHNHTIATLRPCREESIKFDTTQNLFIEGDNLEVLKLLQRSYSNKVKMIYIDPPYNTGKDFIYPDDYTENLDTYLRYTEQKDEEGRKFATNTESDGRYHSKWLSMMYPRLYLAKSLL